MRSTRSLAAWRVIAILAVGLLVLRQLPSSAEEKPAEKQPAETKQPAEVFKHGNWPFQPPQKPAVPSVRDASQVANPIDAFIVRDLDELGLTLNAPADKLALLRRVSFDLIGLPPTLDEQRAFLADKSPQAYERVVDRLLASPHYGERAAQRWLDLVRYAETDGFNADAHRENAYRYRDYVIQAFNDDLPYNRFIEQQLAGDELEPHNPQALVATGLNRLYPDEWNSSDPYLRRQQILDDITDTTSLVFMGLTMGCAQCHDHKFDEILQTDYYRMQAFFQPMLPNNDMLLASPGERAEHVRKQDYWQEVTRDIRAEMATLERPGEEKYYQERLRKFEPDVKQMILRSDEERTAYEKQIVFQALRNFEGVPQPGAKAQGREEERYDQLVKKLAEFDRLKPAPLPRAMVITDAGRAAPPTYCLAGGNMKKHLNEVQPGFPEFLGNESAAIAPPADVPNTTGRRTALAQWLARDNHPLTARVMVNRLWQYHFGVGIVPSANDFGTMGQAPSHRELLDWLAVEFVEHDWSFKQLHRLMVTSRTYQQSSRVEPQNPLHILAQEKDPQNRKLWHARRQRLEGEQLRDAMLLASGELNVRMFGPSARPELPKGMGSMAWKADAKPEDRNRRSIYVLVKRNLRYPLFDAFDLPDLHQSAPQRSTTTTPPQALTMLNGEFGVGRAQQWAARLLSEDPQASVDLITSAYAQAYARKPSPDELQVAQQFITAQAQAYVDQAVEPKELLLPTTVPGSLSATTAAAVVDFCHALFNANEFLYVD